MQTPFLALMTSPTDTDQTVCNPACPAHLPSCCRSSKAPKPPPAPPAPLVKTPVSARPGARPGPSDLACMGEGTEECSEKAFHDHLYDQTNDPPGTVVIPLPATQYAPPKPGEPPAMLPIPDISVPLSMLQGKAAANAGGRCHAPDCRDDAAEAAKNSGAPPPPPPNAPPPPPPPPPAPPAGPISSGIPGVVEVNPTLVNVPAPSPQNPGVIELKPSEVMIPMDTCPAKCSPSCLPDCDYDCCKPYLDPNIVAEMANELNYMHPNPVQ